MNFQTILPQKGKNPDRIWPPAYPDAKDCRIEPPAFLMRMDIPHDRIEAPPFLAGMGSKLTGLRLRHSWWEWTSPMTGLRHRSMLKKYQDSYGEAMKEFGLERGVLGSAAKHVSNSEYYKLKMENIHENIEMLNQKVLVKQEEVEELERQKASAEEGKSYIYSLFNKGKLSEARKLIEKQNGEIESLKEQIARLEKEKTLLYKQSEKKHSDLTSTINSLIRNADEARRQIRILEERNRQLDRKANPHRYRLSSGAVLTNLYVSPKHVSIPNVHIWTKVKEETHEEYKYIEWQNDALQRFYKDEITEYELVNAIFEPFEQISQKQAQLLGIAFELMAGGPAQTHIGTGGGGSSSDMPWGEKKKGSIKR